MGLAEVLTRAFGKSDWDIIGNWLRDNYLENESEKRRVEFALKRERCYQGLANGDMNAFIESVFQHPEVKKLRRQFLDVGAFVNVIRRVVGEKATVYNEPARRSVEENQMVRYKDLEEACRLDEVMREANRRLVLDEDVMLNYRVRVTDEGPEPVIDVIGPGRFWILADPLDPTRVIGRIIEAVPALRKVEAKLPHYHVEAGDIQFKLDGNKRVMVETAAPLPYGHTWVLINSTPPTARGKILADRPSADLVSAHLATWFVNLCLLKETKSATIQVMTTGDTSATPVGQMSDSEGDVHLGEGVTVTQINRHMDLAMFRDVSDYVLERMGAGHGLPPSVLHHRDSSSGSEIHLRRIPLRELRRQQIMIMRRAEKALASIMARVNAAEAPQYAFDAATWAIDFGEVEQPLTEAERDQVFETRRRLLLTDTAEEIMRRNPDIKTPAEAMAEVDLHVSREVERVIKTQVLSRLNGSSSSGPDVATPEENGAEGVRESES